LSKYCGEEKAMELMNEVVANFTRFHPKPEDISCSDPKEEPEFIKPYFDLRMSLVWHIGSNYLHEIAKNWYQYLLNKGITFIWNTEVTSIDFNQNTITGKGKFVSQLPFTFEDTYNKLIFAVGKSGIDFAQELSDGYKLPTEAKAVQIGVRFEAPQKYFQKLIDVSYDFKLYQKHDNISIRSFCTNNNAAYVAVEETYGDISYNGHAKKGEEFRNDMTNFGILMEIKGIEDPFKWSRDVVQKLQFNGTGLYYSTKRVNSKTSEGEIVNAYQIHELNVFKEALGEYADYVLNFIDDMNKVFEFGNDFGIYIPEVKYAAPEPLTNHNDISLIEYPNVHFAGDALSARGITVAGSHGIYIAESILKKM
jgi:uncharacterized FAD-dependent dehydrogenase